MNTGSVLNEWAVVAFVVRWTALLALAWFGHLALTGRNPRWRVALWRAAMVGVVGIGLLTLAPPVLTVPVVPAPKAVVVPAADAATSTPRFPDPGLGRPASSTRRQDSGHTVAVDLATAGRPVAESWRIAPALVGLWAVGGLVLAARLALAWFGLGRMIGRSDEAPGQVVEQCRDVAKAIGSPPVRVVCSAEMATPCLAGLRRPVLLLPARALGDDDLRAVLAHELAHARGHDLAWNLVAHVATIVLWFHPLAWRLRSAHSAACDAVCDAVAADFLGDVPTYARTLARLALVALEPPLTPALAMARSSDIRRRVDALNRKVFQSPLPRRLALPAVLGVGVLLILIGGLAVTEAGPPTTTKPPAEAPIAGSPAVPATTGRLEIQAVAATTGKPLEAATVVWLLRINNSESFKKTTGTTGPDGRAHLEWPAGATVNGLQFVVTKPGFAPYSILWHNRTHPIQLPASKILRLVPGITIGGVVNDEAGMPVAGAKITVHAPLTESEISYMSSSVAETTSDPQGRWRVDEAPADLSDVTVRFEAHRFLQNNRPPSRELNAVTILKRGFTVKGRVLDLLGKPIAGAKASEGDRFGSERRSITDDHGDFVLENCPPGASVVTVQAEGYAPDLRDVHPEDQPTLEFLLRPGSTVRGRVVDSQGKPVAGAWVAADEWRRHCSLAFRVDTDKDGRFEWRSAPSDALTYSFGKQEGYMSRRNVTLAPSNAEQTITLDPNLVISGRVTDASTGKPVPAFRVVQGPFLNRSHVNWSVQDAPVFTGGRFTIKHSEAYAGYVVRIEAPGYKPAESRDFKPGEIRPTFDVSLTRAVASDHLTGTVVRPDGQPAAGAVVALGTRDHPVLFESEQVLFNRNSGVSFAKTGPDGRFKFDVPDGPFLLAAMSDDGYAESGAKSGTLVLQAWGKVKGQAFIGQRPAANQLISIGRRDSPPERNGVHSSYHCNTRTDAQGRFVFEPVIPGASVVSRVVVTEFGNGSSQHMGCWQEPVDVGPGETVEVRIGGKGHPVVGRVVLKAAPGVLVDWRQNQPATMERPRDFNPLQKRVDQVPHQNDRFAASLDKDGRFRVDDVPPGHYELTVTIDGPARPNQVGPGNELGRVKVLVDVPEGDDDAPVNLGEIEAEVKGR